MGAINKIETMLKFVFREFKGISSNSLGITATEAVEDFSLAISLHAFHPLSSHKVSEGQRLVKSYRS